MYCTQIKLPHAQHDASENKELEDRPDNFILKEIFNKLHSENKFEVKYALGFPDITQNNFGRTMQVFTNTKDEAHKLVRDNSSLFNIIANYCIEYKEKEFDENISPSYSLKSFKEGDYFSKARLKRLLKRACNDSEVYLLSKTMDFDNLYEKINNDIKIKEKKKKSEKKPFIIYKSNSNSKKFSFFVEKIDKKQVVNLTLFNKFGFSNQSSVPFLYI